MSHSKNFNNCEQNQPLNNTLAITNSLSESLQLLKLYKDRKENYPSIIVLKNVSQEEAESIAQEIANEYFKGILSEKDIISNIDPSNGSIRNSNRKHPLHVDGTFEPKNVPAFALYFQEVDDLGGGASIFKPIKYILDLLGEKDVTTFTKYPVVFAHKNEDNFIDRTHPTYAVRQDNNSIKQLRYAWDNETNMLLSGILEEEQRILVWDAINVKLSHLVTEATRLQNRT